jgi:spore coat polysaccharide biosynthesis predicted glycosyltransferase SpsG
MPYMKRLIVRADASPSIGLGHIMRSLAYAEAARERGIGTLFASTDGLGAELASRRGFAVLSVSDIEDTSWGQTLTPGDVVLFDAYHLSPHALSASARAGVLTVVMDDAVRAGHVDVVICPEYGAAPEGLPTRCTALCGMRYAPIRSEFSSRRRPRGSHADRSSLVIVLGGADTTGLTAAVVRAAAGGLPRAFSNIQAVMGPGAVDCGQVDLARDVLLVRDPPCLHELFDDAVAAISAAGVTAWELYCMGVPTAIIDVSSNQTAAAQAASTAGAALYLGQGSAALPVIPNAVDALADPDVRRRLSTAALAFVDGEGARRVIDELDQRATSIRAHSR